MRVVINAPFEPNGQLPISKHKATGRNCLVLPFPLGVLVRVEESSDQEGFAKRVSAVKGALLFFAVDSTDPGLAGIWVRETDLAQVPK